MLEVYMILERPPSGPGWKLILCHSFVLRIQVVCRLHPALLRPGFLMLTIPARCKQRKTQSRPSLPHLGARRNFSISGTLAPTPSSSGGISPSALQNELSFPLSVPNSVAIVSRVCLIVKSHQEDGDDSFSCDDVIQRWVSHVMVSKKGDDHCAVTTPSTIVKKKRGKG